MGKISCRELDGHLKGLSKKDLASVYLIHGDDYLYRSAFEKLIGYMLPPQERELNCTYIDGADGNIYEGIDHLNTFSFLPGIKVVVFRNSKVLYSKQSQGKLLEKAIKILEPMGIRLWLDKARKALDEL